MKLKPLNLKAIELMVYTDMTYLQIADEIKCNNNTITQWLKDADFQKALQAEMHRKFSKLAVKATKKLEKLIDCENDNVALGAVKECLSKAGYDAVQKVEETSTVINVSVDE